MQRCFNVDLTLCDVATSYLPKNNVERALFKKNCRRYRFKVLQKFTFHFNRRSHHHAHKRKKNSSYWNNIGVKYLQHFILLKQICDIIKDSCKTLWHYSVDRIENSSHFCVCMKCKTHCNCLCSSYSYSCFSSRSIRDFGIVNWYYWF